MTKKTSNEDILEQLNRGFAEFELSSYPLPSLLSCGSQRRTSWDFLQTGTNNRFFARTGSSIGGGGPTALKKAERYSIQKVAGDGRCMFRALAAFFPLEVKVKGMALNKGTVLSSREERENADELRMAVKEVICDSGKERLQYEEALIAITVEDSLKSYCERIGRPDFWGGESELLVLSKLCSQPIAVYIPEHEHGGRGYGFIPIAEYGSQFLKGSGKGKPRRVVRLLYSGKNHYDLLV